MAQPLRFLIIGDLVGDPGLALAQKWIPRLREEHKIDAVIVNGENSAKNGQGITPKCFELLKNIGVNVVTTGNHAFDSKEVTSLFKERDDLLRPLNFHPECPGKGYTFLTIGQHMVAVVNIHGRVFVKELLDCPFRMMDSVLTYLRSKTPIILVDFHAEATSEKRIFGMHLDGRVSGVFGTHTHVQTADEMILPRGTGYITDLGCSGSMYSIIGFSFEGAYRKMVVHPRLGKFEVETNAPLVLTGIVLSVDPSTGQALNIERIKVVDHDLVVAKSASK
ncbi:TIGR00282 family metallophosphoesterase [Candidatus Dependentiae bacterium]|nr:TIGR00282 family metallophosphoesterase [Candidatus Dependentiae bacterium]